MGKTRLKHLMNVEYNLNEAYGKRTEYMIWSPVHHCWLYQRDLIGMNKRRYKFLMNQKVIRVSLRNDNPNYIAIFLEDYDKPKKEKLRKKYLVGY